jgi:UDPglucose 6-dehydrogenase
MFYYNELPGDLKKDILKGDPRLGVVGLWHLGCVIEAAWSGLGFSVTGFDYAPETIDALKDMRPPIFEPGLEKAISASVKSGTAVFTGEIRALSECDYVFIAFDTPVTEDDGCDLSPIERAVRDLGQVMKDGSMVIVSSQVPVGTCRRLRTILQLGNPKIELVYSPENLRLGGAIECYLNPGRVIIGSETERASQKASALFKAIKTELLVMGIESAEMVKHAINAYLASSVVFADHLSLLCESTGADIVETVRGLKTDPRIGPFAYLSPGIGFSGGTLARDLKVLSDLNFAAGKKAHLFDALLRFNSERKDAIIERVAEILGGPAEGRTIAALGLTYKPGTSTLRRSLAVEIANMLADRGATVRAYDPKADYRELKEPPRFKVCSSVDEALSGSECALLLTEWSEFREYNWSWGSCLVKERNIFDTKNFLKGGDLAECGFKYYGVGTGGARGDGGSG